MVSAASIIPFKQIGVRVLNLVSRLVTLDYCLKASRTRPLQ